MGQPETWKSPRKIEEEVRNYRRKRFEDYMVLADNGELTRELACTALREEIEYSELDLSDLPEAYRGTAA